jgi:hypothetical protein
MCRPAWTSPTAASDLGLQTLSTCSDPGKLTDAQVKAVLAAGLGLVGVKCVVCVALCRVGLLLPIQRPRTFITAQRAQTSAEGPPTRLEAARASVPAGLQPHADGTLPQPARSLARCPPQQQHQKPSRSVKRSSVQRRSVPALGPALANAHPTDSRMGGGADDEHHIGLPRTATRLSQWKRITVAECAAAERTHDGTHGLTEALSLGLRSSHLRLKQPAAGVASFANGVSTRVGSLTNGLP